MMMAEVEREACTRTAPSMVDETLGRVAPYYFAVEPTYCG
jgi:hypothetical protein